MSKSTASISCLVRFINRAVFCTSIISLSTDVLLVNQTSNTLQNLCLDFATLGDLKIVERPTVYNVAPNGFQSIKATIKVSSTETGVIFGSILWEGPDLSEQAVILNDIHVDIMDYIKPAFCTEAQACALGTHFRIHPSR
jgi:coatomer subunit beta